METLQTLQFVTDVSIRPRGCLQTLLWGGRVRPCTPTWMSRAEEFYILLGSSHIYVFVSFQASWLSSVYVTDGQTLQTLLGQSRNGRLARRYTPTWDLPVVNHFELIWV